MGGEICYQKGRERGPWLEIKTVKDIIISKEKRGADAAFEYELLKSWSKYPGYGQAKEALAALVGNRKNAKVKEE